MTVAHIKSTSWWDCRVYYDEEHYEYDRGLIVDVAFVPATVVYGKPRSCSYSVLMVF